MAFITRDSLRRLPAIASQYERATANQNTRRTKTASVQGSVFLSHSHTDADLIEPAVQVLASQGVVLYIDWKDASMPAVTSPATAARLKAKINECRKFVVLATNNALASRWVPWELGVADMGVPVHIAIFPITDSSGRWDGNEYLGIYPRIEQIGGTWHVLTPGGQIGVPLSTWLQS